MDEFCRFSCLYQPNDIMKLNWMAWYDHGCAWDKQWHFEYAATMFMAWSEGENIFKANNKEVTGSAEAEVYSLKSLRWQASSLNHQ